MTIEAYVENGQIVLPGPLSLPDGTKVTVSVAGESKSAKLAEPSSRPTINDRLRNVIGQAQALPEDFAENHDHYLHGTAKKAEP